MTPVGHVMILASAGSGKTYQLTNRFVKLLARGSPPERIVALTFTRKAAGEFFDEILTKLAAAAAEPARADQLAREIGERGLGCGDFLRLLRATTDAMHRLSLGTLDSFFARLVRNFPLELGLGGDFEILQEPAARIERRRVLRRMFAGAGALTEAQRGFIEAFKRATFGREEKRLGHQLDRFLDEYQEMHHAAPAGAAWGNPQRIWPGGCAWLAAAAGRAAAGRALRAALPWATLAPGPRQRWEDFFATIDAWSPGAMLPAPVAYILQNALKVWGDLRRGSAEMTVERRPQVLAADGCAALVAVVSAIIGAELERRLEVTRGIFAVLHGYEAFYDDLVRRAGRLTFADVQRLLQPAAGAPLLASHREAARDGAAARLFIDFRLDARFDHWLLDEFQDTSFGQWSVLRNLIDEAVQDATHRRSFFYVGDIKQAIFTWREGDPRLFREIFEHYNRAAPGVIREERLDQSFRSGPAVIAAVNRVFGAAGGWRGMLPAAAVDAWVREWRDHTPAHPELGGQAALLQAEDEAGRFARTLEVLREVDPLGRGLTCAVLVRTNDLGARLADYLRREGGLPALAEADLQVCVDNPLGSALLALVKAAAHPGDTLAWQHVRMTPLGAVLAAEGLANHDALTRRILDAVHAEGFEPTIEAWLRRLEPHLAPDDAFSRERGAQLAAAAARFDETGSRDVMDFIRFMESHTEREAESAAAVRVMTIHKAKGLGFDLVVLPDLEGSKLDQRRDGLAVQKAADRSVEWILDLPPRQLCGPDEILSAHIRAAEAEACYEKLSLLYVAMTRARRAMYLIIEPPGSSTSNNFPRLLATTLDGGTTGVRVGRRNLPGSFSTGDPDWHAAVKTRPAPARGEAAIKPLAIRPAARGRRLQALRPSQSKTGVLAGAALFSLARRQAVEFGASVHALFAAVEWWHPAGQAEWVAARRREGASEAVVAEVLGCLNEPALAQVFARPAGAAEVWRERPFEIVLDETWITGVFDRVVVGRDATGQVAQVTVFDFKTDRVAEGVELARAVDRHAEQLNLYRRVAAVLTGPPAARVGCQLVITDRRRAATVPASA